MTSIRTAASKVSAARFVVMLHHNDTDGLCSGAILSLSLQRLGIKFQSYCLEKTYPQAMEKIIADPSLPADTVIIIADFASGMLPLLSKFNQGRRQIIVLDHHKLAEVDDPTISPVNPRSHGLSGSLDCSAAAVCAAFTLELSELNSDLIPLGVLGAFGDSQVTGDGKAQGLNAELLKQGTSNGSLRVEEGKLQVKSGEWIAAARLKRAIDALGSVDYFSTGPDAAMQGLMKGFDERFLELGEQAALRLEGAVSTFLKANKVETEEKFVWFELDDSFQSMGVKTVGLVCEALRSEEFAVNRYILGFQEIPQVIPGLGPVMPPDLKVSMRLGANLRDKVMEGSEPPLDVILPAATEKVDGFVDACHMDAAATTVPKEKKPAFLDELRKILS